MTDARFPERWLNDRRVRLLSDSSFRLFVVSLAWSVANRTDGVVTMADLELLPAAEPRCIADLVEADLWEVTPDGWLITVYEDTQTTSHQLEHLDRKRRLDRDRQRRKRERDAQRDVTRDDSRTGQARTGQDRHLGRRPGLSGSVPNSQNRRVPDGSDQPAPDDYVAHDDLPVSTPATGSGRAS